MIKVKQMLIYSFTWSHQLSGHHKKLIHILKQVLFTLLQDAVESTQDAVEFRKKHRCMNDESKVTFT